MGEIKAVDSPMVPDRVLLNDQGQGCAPRLEPDYPLAAIFIRDDGWTLGASAALVDVAQRLYADTWIARWNWNEETGSWVKQEDFL